MRVATTCLSIWLSLAIHVTKGFNEHKWMNTITDQPNFTVHSPGTYFVSVSNYCGSKTDTIQILQQCDYPIVLPAAFTPNNDGLNDAFRIPAQNKNKLLLFSIYNRYGQKIFTSTDKRKGWDGFINGAPAENGRYTYLVSMKGITGKHILLHGTVLLIK